VVTSRRHWIPCILAALALGAPTLAMAQSWNGWARCELQNTGSGYSNTETHTWIVRNVASNSPSQAGTGGWAVAGQGSLYKSDGVTSERAEWSIGGASPAGRFIVQVSGGMATIRPVHSQLTAPGARVGYTQQTISGSARSPVTFAGTAWEWPFPNVQGSASGQTISGSSSATSAAAWSYQQPYGSVTNVNCQWLFANGSIPPDPPAVNPPQPPQPPGTTTQPPARPVAELPWSGFVECEASAAWPSFYQETQVHRWDLHGAKPTPAANGTFEHRAEWKLKGNGSSRNRQETASWTTQGVDKTSFVMFIRPSDGMLVMQSAQSPKVVTGGLKGTRQSTIAGAQPVPISIDAWEMPAPLIESKPGLKTVRGKSSSPLTARLSRLQPPNATGTSNCRWNLRVAP